MRGRRTESNIAFGVPLKGAAIVVCSKHGQAIPCKECIAIAEENKRRFDARLIPPPEPPQLEKMEDLGPKLWAELHTSVRVETLHAWEARIPSYGCPCLDSYKKWKSERPPENENDFFAWTIWLHNKVNYKLGKQPISMTNAKSMWRNEFPKQKNKAIVTIAVGQDYKQLLEITGPTHRAYAERVGADYIQLTNQLYADWKQEKFRAGIVGEQYDQTLFVDCDVIIRDRCPDVFQVDGVYIHDDLPKLRYTKWCEPEIKQVAASQQVDSWCLERCLNSGFFVFTKTQNPWIFPLYPLPDTHCSEQWWVDRNISNHSLMNSKLNWQWWFHDFWDGVEEAFVVHLANCPSHIRLDLAKKLIAGVSTIAIRSEHEDQWKKQFSS